MRRDAAKAKDYAQRHNVPKWYANAQQLISDPDINAIYIATPPSSHEEYTLAAIAAGKPVYVEKPMANTYSAALNMAHAAKATNVKLTVAHYRRQQPFFLYIKQLLQDNAIGQPLLARIVFDKLALTATELTTTGNTWRTNPAIAGGGLFHDLAPHQLDLMYYFFGPAKKVNGIASNQGGLYAADDMVAGNILFENGVAFSGSWCFNAPIANDYCEITGTTGKITFSIFSGHTITLTSAENIITTFNFDPLQHVQQPMIDKTVQYFLGNTHNPCSGEEGAEVMRMMGEMVGV